LTQATILAQTSPETFSLPELHRSVVVFPVTAFVLGESCSHFPVPVSLSRSATWISGNWVAHRSLLARKIRLRAASLYDFRMFNGESCCSISCIKLGVATGRDLAQASCRINYSRPTVWVIVDSLRDRQVAGVDLAEVSVREPSASTSLWHA